MPAKLYWEWPLPSIGGVWMVQHKWGWPVRPPRLLAPELPIPGGTGCYQTRRRLATSGG